MEICRQYHLLSWRYRDVNQESKNEKSELMLNMKTMMISVRMLTEFTIDGGEMKVANFFCWVQEQLRIDCAGEVTRSTSGKKKQWEI